MENRKYTKNFQRKKKTVKEEHRFSMVLDFSSATLKLENNETMSSRRQGKMMFNLGLHIQTNLIVSKWNEVIPHVQVFKNFISLYILLESYWRIYKLRVYAKTEEDRNPEM